MPYLLPKEGKKCKDCPLFEKGVNVLDSIPPDNWDGLSIVGETPGREEVKQGLVFVGESGRLLNMLKNTVNLPASHITNSVRCGLPGGAKLSEKDMQLAMSCCRPMLINNFKELRTKAVICLGATALESMVNLKGIDRFRGCVFEGAASEPWKVTCTYHPAAILRQESWRVRVELLADDLIKAHKLASGTQIWEPEICNALEIDELCDLLDEAIDSKGPLAVDTETDGLDALTCNLRVIGIAYRDDVISAYSIPWPNMYGTFWTQEQWDRIEDRLYTIWNDPEMQLVFHNKIYDIPVLERHFGTDIQCIKHDTLLIHHALYPKLPHRLQQVVSQFVPVEPWKSAYEQTSGGQWAAADGTKEEFSQLLWYNAFDAGATLCMYEQLIPKIHQLGVSKVVDADRELMDAAVDWFKHGILLDLNEVDRLSIEYVKDIKKLYTDLKACCGLPSKAEVESIIEPERVKLDELIQARKEAFREVQRLRFEIRKQKREAKAKVSEQWLHH